MIHITLGAMRPVDPQEDQLGRDHVGWHEEMSDEMLFRANRGCWVLGERAEKERATAESRLESSAFRAKAPPAVVARERERLSELAAVADKLRQSLAALGAVGEETR